MDSLGEKKPLRAVTRQTKLIYNTIQYSTVQYITLHYTIIPYNTIIPLYNVYTLGYPDGFIQCIYSWIPWWFYTMYILWDTLMVLYTIYINNPIYSVRWIANISTIQCIPLDVFPYILAIRYIPLGREPCLLINIYNLFKFRNML